jgi:1-acyl-sn-glycerol-3-phosphate acyltransferase
MTTRKIKAAGDNKLVEGFKNVFARIWATWGILSFGLSFIIIFLPSMAAYLFKNENRGQAYFIWVSKMWMDTWLFFIGCPLKVTGREHFKKGENYVVVFNHNALLDVPLSAPHVPGPNKTIAKASFAKVPIFGWFYRRGSVLVDRNNDRSRIKSFEDMKEVLLSGMHMCIYPEGTRNRTSEPMKPFFDGAFRIAIDTQKAIIPCVISGTKRAMPIHKKFYLWPTRLRMDFLPAEPPGSLKTKALKEIVFHKMTDHYIAMNPGEVVVSSE